MSKHRIGKQKRNAPQKFANYFQSHRPAAIGARTSHQTEPGTDLPKTLLLSPAPLFSPPPRTTASPKRRRVRIGLRVSSVDVLLSWRSCRLIPADRRLLQAAASHSIRRSILRYLTVTRTHHDSAQSELECADHSPRPGEDSETRPDRSECPWGEGKTKLNLTVLGGYFTVIYFIITMDFRFIEIARPTCMKQNDIKTKATTQT